MANCKVINIHKDHEPILSFLFPTYSVVDSPSVTRRFITHRDIRTKVEREALDFQYDDCVFISTQIFDEFWDEDKIKEECVNFSRKVRNRKKNITTEKDTFVADCVSFIFQTRSEEEEQAISELFESFGSKAFLQTYVNKLQTTSNSVLKAAMTTFIQRILSSDSLYYKKKAMLFSTKIQQNLPKAVDTYLASDQSDLATANFFYSLV